VNEESRLAAYHEAGHMVAAWELGLNVLGATIVPDAEAGYAGRVVVPIEDRVRYAD
jgi:ATP-dependent Zn protease